MTFNDRRVVVTGVGVVSPIGIGVSNMWDSMVQARSGVAPITLFDASEFSVRIAAEVKNWDSDELFGKKHARHLDRFSQFALTAAAEAVNHSGLDVSVAPHRVGVVFGSGIGGIATLEREIHVLAEKGPSRVNPFMCPMMIPNMAAGEIAMAHGATGPNLCTVTACAASAHAIGEAYDQIRLGRADAVICGGSEAPVTPISLSGFATMRALSTRNDEPERASRPFDAGRDGFVAGEGAGALILEERQSAVARGADILAEVVGYGLTGDAYHMTAPHPEGLGAIGAMTMALGEAGITPEQLGYVNAHGTSTPANDRTETLAVKKVLGTGVPVSSTKSVTGHLLGAAGAIEAVACIQVLRTGLLPPTANYEEPDPECDLDYIPNQARPADVGYVMSNSFGFGGHNATLILARP